MVEFDLPGLEERERMLKLYLKKYLDGAEGATKITVTAGWRIVSPVLLLVLLLSSVTMSKHYCTP